MELSREGAVAYDAWRTTHIGHNPDGSPTPEWEDLPEDIRKDWASVESRVKTRFGAIY